MTSPFDAVRRAVSGYASRSSPSSSAAPSSSAPGEGAYEVIAAVAVLDPVLGALVARVPAAGYPRLLEHAAMEATVVCPVHIYAGAIAPSARLTSHDNGQLADYSPARPRYVAQGLEVLIVWETVDGVASANLQFREA